MDKPPFEESLRALAARRRGGESHPTPDELIAYRAGDLTPEEDDVIQEHLTQCRECARLLLDLAEFEQLTPPPVEIGPVDVRAEASWQRLRSRLREENEPTESGPVKDAPVLRHQPRPRVSVWRSPMLPWALAAGLALCVAGLGLQMGSLGRQIEDLSGPQAVRAVVLQSEENTLRSEGGPASIHTGEGVAYDLDLLSDPDAPRYPLYSIEIVPVSGSAKPIQAGRQPADDGLLRVVLLSAPEPGDYYFQVSGVQGANESPVGRFPFRVLPVE